MLSIIYDAENDVSANNSLQSYQPPLGLWLMDSICLWTTRAR